MQITEPQQAQDDLAPSASARSMRQRALKGAVISYSDGAISLDCLVRDYSPGGVKIKLVSDTPVPNSFSLHIPTDGIRAQCEVRWRRGVEIGVEFIGEIHLDEIIARQIVIPTGRETLKKSVLRD